MCNTFLNIKQNERILVVAPHPDDESIGCGGLLLKYGAQADVLLLANGCGGYDHADPDASPEKMVLVRKQEFEQAMRLLHVNHFEALNIPDSEIYRSYARIRRVDVRNYDYIFVTSRFELSQDHRHAYFFLKKMIKKQHAKARLIEYEVWTPFRDPNRILDISDLIERKMQLVSVYRSQLQCYDYVNFTKGLSLYRGGRFKKKNVEAYFVQPRHYHLTILIRGITSYAMRQGMKNLIDSVRRFLRKHA